MCTATSTGQIAVSACTQQARSREESVGPLFRLLLALPDDVLVCVLDHLAAADLAALARTAWALHRPATRTLYGCIDFESPDSLSLRMLVCTLEARPELGKLVLRFSLAFSFQAASDLDFDSLQLEAECSDVNSDVYLLTRALHLTPNLRALTLYSSLDNIIHPDGQLASALRALSSLDTLHLSDATPETLALLQHLRPMRSLSVRRVSVGWGPELVPSADGLAFLEHYLLACRATLRELEIHGEMLEDVFVGHPLATWDNVRSLRVQGRYSRRLARAVVSAFPGLQWQPDGDGSSCRSAGRTSRIWRIAEMGSDSTCGAKASNIPWEACGPLLSVVLGALFGMVLFRLSY